MNILEARNPPNKRVMYPKYAWPDICHIMGKLTLQCTTHRRSLLRAAITVKIDWDITGIYDYQCSDGQINFNLES